MIVKNGLQLIPTDKMSRKVWLAKRRDGLGGSDMGTIMGVNKNFSRLELFYQKCGATPESTETNNYIFWGNALEDQVLDKAQYLDLETGEYMENYENKKKLRRISKFKYMVKNPEYPWLIANVDGLEGLRNFKAKGISEMKTISRQAAEMWESFPVYHWFQVIMYHTVLRPMLTTNFSKIFYLQDGRELRGYEIEWSKSAADTILESSYNFWQLVLKGKEIVKNTPDKDLQLTYLAKIEPEPEASPAYLEFLSELYKMKVNYKTINGTEADMDHAKTYVYLGNEIKLLTEQRDISKAHIIKRLKDDSANIIQFPNRKAITYNKRLYVNI